MITVTLTNPRHIAGANAACAADNAARAASGNPALTQRTTEQYVQDMIDGVAESWAETTGVDRISVAAFVRRFPGSVMDSVNAARLTDPTVAAILAQLDAVTHVRLGAQTTVQGVGYLVAAGYMTQAQADVVLAYEVPAVP